MKAVSIRISITVSPEARRWLATEADRRSVSIADLVRRILDETRGAYVVPREREISQTTI